jgi:hypothetical protein
MVPVTVGELDGVDAFGIAITCLAKNPILKENSTANMSNVGLRYIDKTP